MNKRLLVRAAFSMLLIVNAVPSAYAEEPPSLDDLLGRYEKSLEMWNRIQFRVRQEERVQDSDLSETAIYVMREEIYRDGERFEIRSQFGYSSPPSSQKKASFVWDGKRSLYFFPAAEDEEGNLVVGEDSSTYRRVVDFASVGSLLWGGLKGNNVLLLSLLRSSKDAALEKQMDVVGGIRCYVVTANTPAGKFRLWFNPARGYQVAKAEVSKVAADSYYGVPMSAAPPVTPDNVLKEWPAGTPLPPTVPMADFHFHMDVTKFEEVDGHWVPVGITWESRIRYNGDRMLTTSATLKASGVDLNPDFESLGAFELKVPNGTQVRLMKNNGSFVWNDGEIIPKKAEPQTKFRPLIDF